MMEIPKMLIIPALLILISGSEADDRDQHPPAFEEILKIDIHSHIYEEMPAMVELLQEVNARIVNINNRGLEGQVEVQLDIARSLFEKYPDLFPFASTFDLRDIEQPDFASETIEWLDFTFESGAVMVKIWKEIGMELQNDSGEYIMPDDPVFHPVYQHLADRDIPLLAHQADPIDAWRALDPESVHYGYFSQNPEWHLYGRDDIPQYEEIIASRDRILNRFPELIVIGAHLGSLEHDVEEIAKRLDAYSNFYVEVSARTRDLTRQSREKVRQFFIDYQDRILYGIDFAWRPYRDGARTEEKRKAFIDRYEERLKLDYAFYAGTDSIEYADHVVKGLGLPKEVLDKFYFENAERIVLKTN